jgi:glutamate synthase domain-containing protein 2
MQDILHALLLGLAQKFKIAFLMMMHCITSLRCATDVCLTTNMS